MFGKLFGKKDEKNPISLLAPVSGELVQLEDVPDPVFSEKMMGDGIAIKPAEGVAVSPVDGKVMQVFPTKHAVGLQAENGAEILIHIGLETVSLDGEGFTSHISEGDRVKQGDKLISFDLDVIETKAKSTLIPIIITNSADMRSVKPADSKQVAAGEDEILAVEK